MKPPSDPALERASPDPKGSDVLALAPPAPATIHTRPQLARTKLGEDRGFLRVVGPSPADAARPSLATRHYEWQKRKRRKRLLIAVALLLALFPPMWAVYLIGWLVWRSRPPQRSMRQVRHGIRALQKNQMGLALKKLQEAHYQDPANSDALYWLGLLLSQQQRHEEAEEALSIVADRAPGLPEVETALVQAYVATDQPESAIFHAQRLLDVAPYDAGSLLHLADAFEAAGRLDLAVEALQQAPLHKPTLTDDLVAVHYRLGTLHQRLGDEPQALDHFKRVYAYDIAYRDVRTRVQALEAGPGV